MILEIECMLIILYLRTKCNNPHDVTTSKEMNLGGGIQRSIVFSIRSLLQNLTRCNTIVTIFHSFVTYLCGQILTTINSKQRRATNYMSILSMVYCNSTIIFIVNYIEVMLLNSKFILMLKLVVLKTRKEMFRS